MKQSICNGLDSTIVEGFQIISGEKSLMGLNEFLRNCVYIRPFIIVSKSIQKLEYYQEFLMQLRGLNIQYKEISSITSNPNDLEIEQAIQISKFHHPDCIISIGGGSILDSGKVISILSTVNLSIWDYKKSIPSEKQYLPLISVPTTIGTGSEVSQTMVITNQREGLKKRIIDQDISSQLIILDPILVTSLPRNIMKETAIDALAHAIEAYTNRINMNTKDSLIELYSLKAIKLIFDNLVKVLNNPLNLKRVNNLQWAALYAGICIRNDLNASHVIAGVIHQYGIEMNHARAVGIILPKIVRFNERYCNHQYASIESKLEKCSKDVNNDLSDLFIKRVELLLTQIGFVQQCRLISSSNDINVLVNEVNIELINHINPRIMTRDDIKMILESVVIE